MLSLKDIDEELSRRIRGAMKRKHWSTYDVANEINQLGGEISAKTVANIASRPTRSEFPKLYWVLRVLGLSTGEALDFTIEDTDRQMHSRLASILRMGARERRLLSEIFQYFTDSGDIVKNFSKGA